MLRLTLRAPDAIPWETDVVAPDRLASLSNSQIAALPAFHGNRTHELGELFHVEGDARDLQVEIEGDCSRIKGLGRNMAAGRLTIRGNAGLHVGAEMTGGSIEVHGDIDDWLGAEMRGGRIHVHGNAKNLVGAAYRGASKGMRGGVILIDGDAGNEVGAHMRRGLIAIGGACGDFAGVSMLAGSLFAMGGVGRRPGAGMKRGSIVIMTGPVEMPPTFRSAGEYPFVFVQLYLRQLREWGFIIPRWDGDKLFRRFSGDLLTLGKGEILVALNQ